RIGTVPLGHRGGERGAPIVDHAAQLLGAGLGHLPAPVAGDRLALDGSDVLGTGGGDTGDRLLIPGVVGDRILAAFACPVTHLFGAGNPLLGGGGEGGDDSTPPCARLGVLKLGVASEPGPPRERLVCVADAGSGVVRVPVGGGTVDDE